MAIASRAMALTRRCASSPAWVRKSFRPAAMALNVRHGRRVAQVKSAKRKGPGQYRPGPSCFANLFPRRLVYGRGGGRRSLRGPRAHVQREARNGRSKREIKRLFGRADVVDLYPFQGFRKVVRNVQL